jgi:outer membrane protein
MKPRLFSVRPGAAGRSLRANAATWLTPNPPRFANRTRRFAAAVLPRLALGTVLLVLAAARAGEAPWTLEQCVRHALTNSPDAVLAEQRVRAARAVLQQAQAQAWPTLQFQSGYLRTDNPMFVLGSALNQQAFGPALSDFNHLPDVDNWNVKGLASVPLYTGGALTAGRRAARSGVQASAAQAEAVRQALAFETVRAFHTIQKTRAFVRAAEAAVASFEQHLALAQKRFDAGTLLRADVLDVEVRLAQAREDLARARNARALALQGLRTLLGLEPGEFDVAETAPEVPAPAAPEAADFSARPELAAVRHQIAAAEAQTRVARSGHLPRLAAFGSVDYDRGWKLEGEGTSYTAGLLLQWNLFDGRLTRGKVAEARAQLDMAQEQERKLKLGLGFEVEQARLNLREANERLAVTARAIAQAEESVKLTRDRFEQGLALTIQLLDAETALTLARVRRAEAEADQRIAIAALRRALGLGQLPAELATR